MILCACAEWSESVHFAHARRHCFARRGPDNELSQHICFRNSTTMFCQTNKMRDARKRSLCHKQAAKAQIRLRIRAVWSRPSLADCRINGYCRLCHLTLIRLRRSLRKRAYSNILKNLQPKKGNFSDKNFSKHRLWVFVRTASARRF